MFNHNKKNDEIKSPCLIGTAGESEGQVIQLPDKLSLGRNKKNDLCFQDKAVSGFHAEIVKVDDTYEIRDLGSKNKTRVNNRRIFKPTVLANNDLIKIGKNIFHFKQPAAGTMSIVGTISINNKDHKPKAYSQEDVVHTQKIPKYVYQQAKVTTPDLPEEAGTEKTPPLKDEIKHSPKPKEGLAKPRKILVNSISACLILFMIILVMIKSVPPTSVGIEGTEIENKNAGPVDPTKRPEYIEEIWKDWGKSPLSTHSNTQEAMVLLDHAQEVFVQTYSGQVAANPEELCLIYKECLKALSYTNSNAEDSKVRTQCQHLNRALQIVIEDQENHYYVLYFTNNARANWDNALDAIKCNVQLLDLDGDNKNSTLAKMYRKLAFQITQKKDKR